MLRGVFKNDIEISVRDHVEMAPGSLLPDLGHVPMFLDPPIMCMLGRWRGF